MELIEYLQKANKKVDLGTALSLYIPEISYISFIGKEHQYQDPKDITNIVSAKCICFKLLVL